MEEKASKPFGFLSQWRLLGEDYIGRAVQFANRLEGYASSGGNLGNMPPELLESARNLKGLGWSDIVLDEMKYGGMMTKGEYYRAKRGLVREAEKGVEEIKKYSGLKKIAPVIFGIIGFFLLILSDFSVTGGVIGVSSGGNLAISVLGIASIVASLVFFLRSPKKR